MKKEMTVAMAEMMLKRFEEDRDYYLDIERSRSTYVVGYGEEPVIPEYNYMQIADKIEECDQKIMYLQNAIKVHYTASKINVLNDTIMSVDMIETRINQLTKRKDILGMMRKADLISRVSDVNKGGVTVYSHINYDVHEVCEDYDMICEEISQLQSAIDVFKHTVLFEVDLGVVYDS